MRYAWRWRFLRKTPPWRAPAAATGRSKTRRACWNLRRQRLAAAVPSSLRHSRNITRMNSSTRRLSASPAWRLFAASSVYGLCECLALEALCVPRSSLQRKEDVVSCLLLFFGIAFAAAGTSAACLSYVARHLLSSCRVPLFLPCTALRSPACRGNVGDGRWRTTYHNAGGRFQTAAGRELFSRAGRVSHGCCRRRARAT